MKVLITGPESTGKTSTALRLAEDFGFQYIPEYARQYLEINGPGYTYDDLAYMASEHIRIFREHSGQNVILDTYMLNFKIWFLYRFKRYPGFIDDALSESDFDIVLLMYPDIEWEFDPLRENRDDRLHLFQQYENELKKLEWPYQIIRGQGNDRVDQCKKLINDCMIALN
ncbi:MAG: ATP-binding protein [Bacteroidia bacterium]|nr:ATP-binding protein [Bacteroidia bacterium]